ncbi:MAG: hypothetical protein Q4D89_06145 [Arachnia propionica]|uniref:hypothetical protein n=1 Tax=Arachnia propionica TaxID=1750 RepID=UPI0027088E3F|nr:hypothetical protein [Arachnia propionica]
MTRDVDQDEQQGSDKEQKGRDPDEPAWPPGPQDSGSGHGADDQHGAVDHLQH